MKHRVLFVALAVLALGGAGLSAQAHHRSPHLIPPGLLDKLFPTTTTTTSTTSTTSTSTSTSTTSTTVAPTTTTTAPTTTAPTTTTTTAPPSGTTYTVPASIASDCSRDVTAELNDWIASLPDGSSSAVTVAVFGSGKCYRVDGVLDLFNRAYLSFEGNGSRFDAGQAPLDKSGTWRVRRGNDITFRNIVVAGGATCACYTPESEFEAGFETYAAANVLIENVHVHNVHGDFVTVANYWDTTDVSRNVTVQNSRFEVAGRMGFGVTAADGVRIVGNYISDVALTPIDLEVETPAGIANVVIDSNTFGRHSYAAIHAVGDCSGAVPHDVSITDNTMLETNTSDWPAINVGATSPCDLPEGALYNYTITGNRLKALGEQWGIVAQWTRNFVFNDNTVEMDTASYPGVDFRLSVEGTLVMKRNDVRLTDEAYRIDGVTHGPGVDACGNVTANGPNQPVAC